MIYYVIELQTNNGTGSSIVTTKTTLEDAYQAYYTIMAAASKSAVPQHGAMIVSSDMFVLENKMAYRSAASAE